MAESMIYGSGKVRRNEAKVSKFGDKITGYLDYMQDMRLDDVPTDANHWGTAAPRFRDADGTLFGYLAPYFRTNGQKQIILRMYRTINGTSYNNYFGLGIDADGTQNYSISNPAPLRKAIGFWESVTYESLSALVAEISNNQANGTLAFYRCGTAIQLFNATSSYAAVAIVVRVSTANAYYLAYNRDKCSIGNISITNGTISVKHNIVT